ncbi:MAG: 5-oxoprolinase subunit PxpB [Flavobacteriaceae bacterium]
MKLKPTIKPFGEKALLLEWEEVISEKMHHHIMGVIDLIWHALGEEVLEIVPAFHSLTVFIKPHTDVSTFTNKIKKVIDSKREKSPSKKILITIPVCYEAPFSMDIEELAHKKNISVSEVIRLHTEPIYFVHFLGFFPGFPYLGGLSERLYFPRKIEPRTFISKGSVGIGGNQTGIYTTNSPGGWNIIGKSPLTFFDSTKNSPALLRAGSYIKFEKIGQEQFREIESQIHLGNYELKKEELDD